MKRRYVIEQYTGGARKPLTSTTHEDPEDALNNFTSLLSAAGHDEWHIRKQLHTWTAALMKGANGFAVLDPDLKGSVEISIRIS